MYKLPMPSGPNKCHFHHEFLLESCQQLSLSATKWHVIILLYVLLAVSTPKGNYLTMSSDSSSPYRRYKEFSSIFEVRLVFYLLWWSNTLGFEISPIYFHPQTSPRAFYEPSPAGFSLDSWPTSMVQSQGHLVMHCHESVTWITELSMWLRFCWPYSQCN